MLLRRHFAVLSVALGLSLPCSAQEPPRQDEKLPASVVGDSESDEFSRIPLDLPGMSRLDRSVPS